MLALGNHTHRPQKQRLSEAKQQHSAPQHQRAHARISNTTRLAQVAAASVDTPVHSLHTRAARLEDAPAAGEHPEKHHDVYDVVVLKIDYHCVQNRALFMWAACTQFDSGVCRLLFGSNLLFEHLFLDFFQHCRNFLRHFLYFFVFGDKLPGVISRDRPKALALCS